MKAAGALAPMNQNTSAPRPIVIAVLSCGDIAGFATIGAAAAAAVTAGAAGAADSFGAGGGQVISPSLITVAPRMTSSSMLTLQTPSLFLQRSSLKRNRLVAYSVLACFDRRLGRSV